MAKREDLAAAKEAGTVSRVVGKVWQLDADQRRIVAATAPELWEALEGLADEQRTRMLTPTKSLH
jgi:hypothetical protein